MSKINYAPLVEARKLLDKGVDQVLVQLKDQSIPLADRWTAYTALVQNNILVKDDVYGDGEFSGFEPEISLYDDFYIERHQTENYIDLYTRMLEADEHYTTLKKFAEKNLEAWMEKVLASGYSSFTYDW